MGNQAAHGNARANAQQRKNGVKYGTADVFKIDVNTTSTGGSQLPRKIGRTVVNASIKTQFLDDVTTFFIATGNADDAATFQLGDLSDYRPNRATGGSHNDGVAGLRLANIE